jgi:uncharacterized protein YidB (DUF937 family)
VEVSVSLFSGILGNVVGSVFGSNPRGSSHNVLGEILDGVGGGTPIHSGMLLFGALSMLQHEGGIDRVLTKLRANGLGAQADSWVGTGPNLPISAEQLQQVFGAPGLERVAAPLNMSAAEAGETMAQLLPELVNQFTPGGQLPPNHADLVAKAMAMLSNARA